MRSYANHPALKNLEELIKTNQNHPHLSKQLNKFKRILVEEFEHLTNSEIQEITDETCHFVTAFQSAASASVKEKLLEEYKDKMRTISLGIRVRHGEGRLLEGFLIGAPFLIGGAILHPFQAAFAISKGLLIDVPKSVIDSIRHPSHSSIFKQKGLTVFSDAIVSSIVQDDDFNLRAKEEHQVASPKSKF